MKAYRLESGDLLFNTRNSEELVGKTALFRGDGLYLFNSNLMRIRFKQGVEPEFIAAALRTPWLQHELRLRKSGTTSVFAIYYRRRASRIEASPAVSVRSGRTGAIE